jgi:hypothetical protein
MPLSIQIRACWPARSWIGTMDCDAIRGRLDVLTAPTHGVGKAPMPLSIQIRAWSLPRLRPRIPPQAVCAAHAIGVGGGVGGTHQGRSGTGWRSGARRPDSNCGCDGVATLPTATALEASSLGNRNTGDNKTRRRRPRALCHCERTAETRRGRHSTARRGGGGRERTSRARTGESRAWLARDGGAPSPGL